MATKTIATGITRFDLEGRKIRGYGVRICHNKRQTNEFFSDGHCGWKRKVLKAAESRYEELFAERGPVETTSTKNKLTVRNTSGKAGVHVARSFNKGSPNCVCWACRTSWIAADGQCGKINFSWNKYGGREAWKLACHARDHETNNREEVLAISLPASALQNVAPVAFHGFEHLRVFHVTEMPTGTPGKTYETACCVNGERSS